MENPQSLIASMNTPEFIRIKAKQLEGLCPDPELLVAAIVGILPELGFHMCRAIWDFCGDLEDVKIDLLSFDALGDRKSFRDLDSFVYTAKNNPDSRAEYHRFILQRLLDCVNKAG